MRSLSSNALCGIDDIGRGIYSDIGIKALASALEVNAVLTELDVSQNR